MSFRFAQVIVIDRGGSIAPAGSNVKWSTLTEKMIPNGFHARERGLLRRLTTPERIQRFLDDEVGYNKEKDGPTCRSPRRVLRDRLAHCLEGALFGAAALRVQGWQPLLLDL